VDQTVTASTGAVVAHKSKGLAADPEVGAREFPCPYCHAPATVFCRDLDDNHMANVHTSRYLAAMDQGLVPRQIPLILWREMRDSGLIRFADPRATLQPTVPEPPEPTTVLLPAPPIVRGGSSTDTSNQRRPRGKLRRSRWKSRSR
jgi:hypothetical protein